MPYLLVPSTSLSEVAAYFMVSREREGGRQGEEKVGGHILEEGAIVAATITSSSESAQNTQGKKKTIF